MLEKMIEKKLLLAVRGNGGMCLKFVSPGMDGMPDRLVLMPGGRLAFVELKVPGKKPRPLQLHRHQTVQFTVKEQQVDVLILAERLQMVLIADKSEILPKGEDEILHIVDDGVLYHPFIHVLLVPDAQLFHIDIVQQIFIFECIKGL